MSCDQHAFRRTLDAARARLLAARNGAGHWEGRLSSSALSTATAVCALALTDRKKHAPLIEAGLAWLDGHQNGDGGFGDTPLSASNVSTTIICRAAFAAAEGFGGHEETITRMERRLEEEAGSLQAPALARTIVACYGKDRTFSVPILTMCALSGFFGAGREAWSLVDPLPFEMAVVPHAWLKRMRLTVVSYALPALIAIGQVRHHLAPPANPLIRLIRNATRRPTLRLLEKIQPAGGGFLEAVPLTGFVVMSLASAGRRDHPVVERGVDFLTRSMRGDGSWPIDTNLATWVTTLSVNAFAAGSDGCEGRLAGPEREGIVDWLLAQQYREVHPCTRAEPGGWAWTDLPGGVPDVDDTAGALLALRSLGVRENGGERGRRIDEAARLGLLWLTGLQNGDGGMPTFCRGWGKLPFDQSAPDLTAHVLAAFSAWAEDPILTPSLRNRVERAISRGVRYLGRVQKADGSWIPLWFGNESAPGGQNPVFGTARVVAALAALTGPARPTGFASRFGGEAAAQAERGARWLARAQNGDGGFGGAPGVASSIEETALAVHALASLRPDLSPEIERGISWLIEGTAEGREMAPVPIGLYFARLWYFEDLYPLIFSLQALEKVEGRIA
jgi:squalene-hopene/tetraprenyl-beta-curcumene cyclase